MLNNDTALAQPAWHALQSVLIRRKRLLPSEPGVPVIQSIHTIVTHCSWSSAAKQSCWDPACRSHRCGSTCTCVAMATAPAGLVEFIVLESAPSSCLRYTNVFGRIFVRNGPRWLTIAVVLHMEVLQIPKQGVFR